MYNRSRALLLENCSHFPGKTFAEKYQHIFLRQLKVIVYTNYNTQEKKSPNGNKDTYMEFRGTHFPGQRKNLRILSGEF